MTITIPIWLLWTLGIGALFMVVPCIAIAMLAYIGFIYAASGQECSICRGTGFIRKTPISKHERCSCNPLKESK